MTTASAQKQELPFKIQSILAVAYGSCSLLTLWATAGGDAQLMWLRMPVLAGGTFFAASLAMRLLGINPRLLFKQLSRADVQRAAGVGLLCALPIWALFFVLKSGSVPALSSWTAAWRTTAMPHPLTILLAAAVFAPAQELLWRHLLQPAWGLGSVAFLQALNAGFGFQHFAPFLAVWGMAALMGKYSQRYGSAAAAIASGVWTLLSLLPLLIL